MQNDVQSINRPEEVARGVFLIELPTPFSVGPVNVYLIAEKELTLVDVGPKTPEAWEKLCRSLQALGYSIKDVSHVILTHHHVDHCGQLEQLRKVSGCRTYAHPLAVPYVRLERDFMQYHDEFFASLYRECGVPEEFQTVITKYRKLLETFQDPSDIDIWLRHDTCLPHLPEWRVFYTPGHSQSHLSLFREVDRVMIAGDHLIKHISSNAFTEPPRDRSHQRPLTLVQYRNALQMCADMGIDLALSGHGEPIDNHRELIASRLQKNWERTESLRQLLADGEKTAFELTALLFPQLYLKELPLTISETLGHIDLLMILHQIEARRKNGVWYYSL